MSPFYECLLYFFIGTFLAREMRQITNKKIFLLILFLITALALRYSIPVLLKYFEIKRIVDSLIKIAISIAIILFFIKAFEGASLRAKKFFVLLGSITYSVYMMHIPLQIILVLSFFEMGVVFFNTKLFFVFYIIISLMLGFFTYKSVEVPAQRYIRLKLMSPRRANKLARST